MIWKVVSSTGFILSIQTSKLVGTKQLNTFSLHLIGESGMLRSVTATHQIREKGENVHRFKRQEQHNYWTPLICISNQRINQYLCLFFPPFKGSPSQSEHLSQIKLRLIRLVNYDNDSMCANG